MFLPIFAAFLFAWTAWTADSYRIDTGTTREVDEHGTCQRVTNNSGLSVFVPTKTTAEWSAFRSNLPGSVTLSACSCAAIALRASATSTSTTASLVITKPAGLAVNDVMVAHVAQRAGSTGTTLAVPSGWTKLDSDQMMGSAGGTNSQRSAAFYKVADAADVAGANFTWTFSGVTDSVGGIIAYSNVEPSDPIDASSTMQGTSNINTIPATAVTTRYTNDMIVVMYAENGNGTYTPPASFNERFDFANGTQISAMGADLIQAAQGTTGTLTSTLSANGDRRTGKVIALKKNTLNCP